ncbi:MAG: pyridoxal phosphate-dependent aminotransferase [Desulfobacteraceae bacterium]|nr:MAG: pyridoxal phosphate-dependent aminotransferase [Desulfobacteraceae bacterium]
MKTTTKTQDIPPFIVMDVLEKAHTLEQNGVDIVHLEIGEPDFPTPDCICEAAHEAIRLGHTHYTHSLGILELREAICSHYAEHYKVEVQPDRVIVTSGTSPALFMLFSALLEAEDEIIMSDPHYPCYPNFARFLGAKPVFVDAHEEDGYQLNVEGIKDKINKKTKAILINSPSNPTGTLLSGRRMEAIVELGLPIISDEIYHGLVYGDKEHSILEFTDRAFVLNGFSKRFAMTGWRLGYIVAPKEFIRPLQKVQQNFFISAGSVSQWAGVAALTKAGKDAESMRQTYDQRRKILVQGLKNLGFSMHFEPSGAFYILVNARHLSNDSYGLAFEILEKAHVGVAPGIDFGRNAEGYLRFSYANSLERIEEGINRLATFLRKR